MSNPDQNPPKHRPGGKGNLSKQKSASDWNVKHEMRSNPNPHQELPKKPPQRKNINNQIPNDEASPSSSMVNDPMTDYKRPHKSEVKSGGLSSETVKSLLECPVCFETPMPPIFSCKTGHIICNDCRVKIESCPLCRQAFSDVRNFIAEKLIENCTFKCGFQDQGCSAMVKGNEIERHSQICNFRPLICPLYPCQSKKVNFVEFVEHLKQEHRARFNPTTQPKARNDINVRNPRRLISQGPRVPYLMKCFEDRTFLQCAEAVNNKQWFWVALLGTPEDASRFRATLTFTSKENKVKSLWMGPVHSIRLSGIEVYFSGLCMVLTEECLKSFINTAQSQTIPPSYSIDITIDKIK